MVEKWDKIHQHFGYFSDGKKEQQGIIRTSCLDSLDRTNVLQSVIGWRVFLMQMSEHGSEFTALLSHNGFYDKFKALWVHNGNALSVQYSGTASTTASLTKNGKEGILGAINHGITSVGRFFINNFEDDFKHQCIDVLLNREKVTFPLSPHEKEVQEKVETKDITVLVASWNAGRSMPKTDLDLSKWLSDCNEPPELAVIGLQEFAPHCAKPKIPGPGDERTIDWDYLLREHLNKIDPSIQYVKMHGKTMGELYICLYARSDIAYLVSTIESAKVKTCRTRSERTVSGALLLSFKMGETTFCMMNCYLSPGVGEYQKRFNEIRTIYYSHVGQNQEKSVPSHEIKFLFGDLNFRLELDKVTAGSMAKRKEFEAMLKKDQFWNQYQECNFLPTLEEEKIAFPPTYKFVRGTSNYDLESKPPAWCDRIFWSKTDLVKCGKYSSAEDINFSTHKPIYGLYRITIRQYTQPNTGISPNVSPGFEEVVDEEVKHPKYKEEEEARVGTLESYDMVCTNGILLLYGEKNRVGLVR